MFCFFNWLGENNPLAKAWIDVNASRLAAFFMLSVIAFCWSLTSLWFLPLLGFFLYCCKRAIDDMRNPKILDQLNGKI